MANNHIIIGIGGTGGSVIRNYRQQIIDKFGKIDGLEQLKNIKFLYIDSNKDDLNSPWNYQGKKISLNGDDIHLLNSGKINEMLHNQSTRQEWMGTESDWGGILKEDTSDKAGNQLRRFGRINLFSELKIIIEKIARKKKTLVEDETDLGTTIHIITGLAGGTGSGSIVDISAKLASIYENENDVAINLYLVLPELGVVDDKAGQYNGISYLKKNGYAAMKELNSLATSEFKPYDFKIKNSRIQTNKRFQAAYIISEKNKTKLSFSDKAKISSIASLLFLKTITTQKETAKKDGNVDPTTLPGLLNTFDTAENHMISAETYWGLSDKFRVPGIYKLAIPKVQIRENFAYLLVLNAFNNLLYKNFDKVGGQGYLDQLITDQNSVVTKEKIKILTYLNSALLDEWYLTYDYLILDKPMLDDKVLINEGINDITIKGAFSKEYNKQYTLLDRTKQYKGNFIKENEILKYLQMEINNYFNQKFKGDGFETYYNNMQKNLIPKAEFIANRIKNKILGKESSRNFPLVSYIDLLQSISTEFIDKLTADLKNKQSEYKKLLDNSQKELNNIREEFVSSFGFFSWIFGGTKKREKAIKNFETTLQQFWIYTISLRGIDYAFQLINSHLKNKLLEVKVEIEKDISKIKERRDSLNKEYLEEKRKIEGKDDIGGFKPVSDSNKLKEFQTILLKNGDKLNPIMQQLEQYIFDEKDKVCNLQNYNNKKLSTIESAFEMVDDILSDKNISDLMVGESDTFYNANIIELLYKKYNGNANDVQLTELFADLDKRSAPMALINGLNKGNIETKHKKLVIIPMIEGVKADNKEILEFYNTLKDKITNTIQGSIIKELTGLDIRNEITICQFLYPIRTDAIDNIIELKKDYDKDKSVPQMLFLVHTEDCSDLVELIPPEQIDEFKNMLLPYVMIISSVENGFEEPYGPEKYWQISGSLSENKNNANIITVQLECNKLDSFLKVDFNKLDKLNTKGNITGFIHPDVFRIIEKRALDLLSVKGNDSIIVEKCNKFIDEYLKQIQNDLLDKTYLRFKSAYQMVIKIINKNKS